MNLKQEMNINEIQTYLIKYKLFSKMKRIRI